MASCSSGRDVIGVCLKWVERRPEVDPLTGEIHGDPRTSGASDADLAALEWALRLAEHSGDEVVVVAAGPAQVSPVLVDALAAGAHRAVRIDMPIDAASVDVARGLALALGGCSFVVCGDYSLDRGTGSVPAYLAGLLDAAQGLGLVEIDVASAPSGALAVVRRLGGGRRERLSLGAPAVLSVEGSVRLRRAPIDALLDAKAAGVEVLAGPDVPARPVPRTAPYRPRPRVLPPPASASARERTLELTKTVSSDEAKVREELVLDPVAAADKILEQLETWGYGGGS